MSETVISGAFDSFEALCARNDELLATAESSSQSLGSVPSEEIANFMTMAASTGAAIADPRDRRRAQTMINFWAAELITRGKTAGEWAAPQLSAPQDSVLKSSDASAPIPQAPADSDLAHSRTQVRISAGARQYRESGDAGWLLTGDALREAEQFAGDDEDIRNLVVASRAAEHRTTRRFRLGLLSVTFVLAFLCVWLAMALQKSKVAENEARSAEKVATAARDEQARAAAEANQVLLNNLAEQAQRARNQQHEFDRLQDALKQVAPLIKRAQAAGEITDSEIPEAMRPLLDALEQRPWAGSSPLPADLTLLRGYDETFLQGASAGSKSPDGQPAGITVPLPRLTDSALANAYKDGQRIDYANFSIVLNKARRAPYFAAVNLQRSAIVPLLRANVPFQYDPRISPEAQASLQAFASSEIDRGQLVNAREIAWGPVFGTDAVKAGRIAAAMVSLMTNVTPQFDTFNRGLWLDTERYARDRFSELSDRITIFTGPVFTADDPKVGELRLPRSFWKVLIANSPDNAASLVVEAYVVSQFGNGGEKVPMGTKFDPELFRVRVADIEHLTGIDFGEIVRGADRFWLSVPIQMQKAAQTTLAGTGDLTDRLQDIIGPDAATRKSAMQILLDAVRDVRGNESSQRRLIESIVALASDKSFASMAPEARVNVLTLLANVPKERWDANGWIDLKAAARRAVADATTTLGGCPTTTQACSQIALLKPKLGWDLAAGRTIYFQFAGMVRDDAEAIADKLKSLGWSIPGEERTAAAAGYNEVRYGDEGDRATAELLAADLRAMGRSGVRAQRTPRGVRSRTPEVWISV